jgi:alkanesulfonate monooxygenase SsuD/methylene tetrahydromethanopterin reductase-like flavin-dependent oxidoreductase (luciferase family)
MSPLIGFTLQERHFAAGVDRLQSMLNQIEVGEIDFAGVLDHLTFWDGAGFDGLMNAAAVAAAHPRIPINITVLILPVRHPVLVARQISSLNLLAPGRLVLGVGVGGEDRREIVAAGVDPSTRGKRMDESLTALRALLDDGEVTLEGEHFTLDAVRIHPTSPRVPILVGGRSNAALRRVGRLGDGWLAFACSAARFNEAADAIQAEAELHGRGDTHFDHGLVVWCGYAEGSSGEPSRLAREMESLYKIPFDKFAKYCFEGSPVEVAKQLAPYADAGCRRFSIIPVGDSPEHEIDCVAETGRELRQLINPL